MLKKELLESYSSNLLKEQEKISNDTSNPSKDNRSNENSSFTLLIISCIILALIILFFILSAPIINLILSFVLTCLYIYQAIFIYKKTKAVDFLQISRYICIGLWGINFITRLISIFI